MLPGLDSLAAIAGIQCWPFVLVMLLNISIQHCLFTFKFICGAIKLLNHKIFSYLEKGWLLTVTLAATI